MAGPCEGTGPGPFRRLQHLCLVVRDLDAATAYWEALGVGPWRDAPDEPGSFRALASPSLAGSKSLRYRTCALENVELHLCAPSEHPSGQRRYLEERGEGVYELGFTVDDVQAAEMAALHSGLRAAVSGTRDDGSSFCYFDTFSDAGVVLGISD